MISALSVAWLAVAGAVGLPPGFADEPVLDGMDQPVDLEFLPDGRLLVLQRTGQIVIADPAEDPVVAAPYLTLPSVSVGAFRGALGLAVAPDFAADAGVYVYSCHGETQRFRLSRFAHAGTTANPLSETVLWEDTVPWSGSGQSHYGGGLDVGPDGMIYLTVGDEDHTAWAQDLTRPAGSILRIGRDGSVPPGNPFADGPGGQHDYIWASGLRNPFRCTWDLETSRLFIGEVGASFNSWEDLHLGAAGANYGWPDCWSGACDDPAHPDCSCRLYDPPVFTYPHGGGPAAIVCGFVYRGDQFPADPYDGALFYADHVREWIRYLTFDETGSVVTDDVEFATGVGRLVALAQGPEGALYFCRYGTQAGAVRRIVHDDGLQAPAITALDADPVAGVAPLAVQFAATATDDDAPLDFRWTFGDGAEADGAVVEHTYEANGHYVARVAVSDGVHTTLSAGLPIVLGTPPAVTIDEPADGATFRAGQEIVFSASATDAEEVPGDDRFTWFVRAHRGDSTETLLGPVVGAAGSLVVPESGFAVDEATTIELAVAVTDSDGFFDSAAVVIEPELVVLTLQTDPAGLVLALDGASSPTPLERAVLVDARHELTAADVQCTPVGFVSFDHWSDGGAADHEIVVPERDVTLTATYVPGGPPTGDATSDGVVDVDDLLAVLLGWGPCDGGAPGCQGDVNCDGVVDVDDLVTVVVSWG